MLGSNYSCIYTGDWSLGRAPGHVSGQRGSVISAAWALDSKPRKVDGADGPRRQVPANSLSAGCQDLCC